MCGRGYHTGPMTDIVFTDGATETKGHLCEGCNQVLTPIERVNHCTIKVRVAQMIVDALRSTMQAKGRT